MNVVSPTGMVHAVEDMFRDGTVVTLCHHHYGTWASWDISVDWPTTSKEVTCKRCLAKMGEIPKKIIHVNQNVIKHNLKYGAELPPCRVQEGQKSRYCREVIIKGPSRTIYKPNDPLSCGARLWIETKAPVELIDEVKYSDLEKQMTENRLKNGEAQCTV